MHRNPFTLEQLVAAASTGVLWGEKHDFGKWRVVIAGEGEGAGGGGRGRGGGAAGGCGGTGLFAAELVKERLNTQLPPPETLIKEERCQGAAPSAQPLVRARPHALMHAHPRTSALTCDHFLPPFQRDGNLPAALFSPSVETILSLASE